MMHGLKNKIVYKGLGNFARIRALPQIPRTAGVFSNPIVKTALISVFTAETLATNYAMIGLPNIKLMDALVFLAAFLFGLTVGLGIAISTWLVYGFINPYGQAGFPLILFLILGECFYAFGGTILRRTSTAKELLAEKHLTSDLSIAAIFGVAGLALTFGYDVLTNFATYMFLSNSLYQALLIGTITGAPFALAHELSNLFFFAFVSPAAILATRALTQSHGGIRST
jgi:hypothetical protein